MPGNRTRPGIKDFHSLGNDILFYAPKQATTDSPTLIILTTWFAAQARHVSKYTNTYKTIYPSASILILPTNIPEMVYRSYATQQRNLAPALPILKEHARKPEHTILLHIFSGGGAHTACQLLRAYRSFTGIGLQVGAMVLDSTPGINTYKGITDGFIGGLPSTPVVKQLLSLLVYGLMGVITLKEKVTREDHFIQRSRKDLNDESLLKSEAGRAYVYSKEDKIIDWSDVESHAKDAEEKAGGLGPVRTYLWGGSGHVGHMLKDREKYWDVLKNLWNDQR